MVIKHHPIHFASDDIPFGGDSNPNPAPAPVAQETRREEVRDTPPREPRYPDRPFRSELTGGITQKEIFLAIVGGMAAAGDFTIGSKFNTDTQIRNAAKHAAGVSSFFYQAAKEAKL